MLFHCTVRAPPVGSVRLKEGTMAVPLFEPIRAFPALPSIHWSSPSIFFAGVLYSPCASKFDNRRQESKNRLFRYDQTAQSVDGSRRFLFEVPEIHINFFDLQGNTLLRRRFTSISGRGDIMRSVGFVVRFFCGKESSFLLFSPLRQRIWSVFD